MANLTQQEVAALFERAKNGDVTVLQDHNVSKVYDEVGNTPLHWAALVLEEALQHPDVSKVKNNGALPPCITRLRTLLKRSTTRM